MEMQEEQLHLKELRVTTADVECALCRHNKVTMIIHFLHHILKPFIQLSQTTQLRVPSGPAGNTYLLFSLPVISKPSGRSHSLLAVQFVWTHLLPPFFPTVF